MRIQPTSRDLTRMPNAAPPPSLATERVSPRFLDIDAWPTADALDAMLEGQLAAVAAVRPALAALAEAIDAAAARIGTTGRLVYAGAGTSGRIAVQDGAELPPTFNWPRERLVFAMAGGFEALTRSVEGAEDDQAEAVRQMSEANVGAADIVLGIAASGTTPYTISAIEAARRSGALTIGIASNAGAPLLAAAEHQILIASGPEVIAGSTRMKAGTAQKIVLNLFSTGLMIKLGRVYRGRMVDMAARNIKLDKRAISMVADLASCDAATAQAALTAATGNLKLAILIANGSTLEAAQTVLEQHSKNLRNALAAVPPRS
jgi:N-acetylmuramic acid 6-phosphate etherase